MSLAKHRNLVEQCHALRFVAEQLEDSGDLQRALDQIEHADAVGPIFDPTMFARRSQAMHEDRDVLRAVQALARLRPRAATQGREDRADG